MKARNRIGNSVSKTLEITCSFMKIEERSKPEKRTELLHNNFVVRSGLIDDLHPYLFTINHNPMVCPEVAHRVAARIIAKVSLWLICRQEHAG